MKFYQKMRGGGVRKFAAVLLLAALLTLSVSVASATAHDWCEKWDNHGNCVVRN